MTAARDKIGIALGTPDTTGPMGNATKLVAGIKYLGTSMVRTRCPFLGTNSFNRIHVTLAQAGQKFVCVSMPGKTPAEHIAGMKALEEVAPGCILALEGPNEPDLNPIAPDLRLGVRTGKGAAALAFQKAMLTAFREWKPHAQYPDADMIAFNDWMQKEQAPYAGFANSHIYPSGKDISSYMAAFNAKVAALGKGQGYITEWGYHNKLGSNAAAAGITEAQAAANLAKDIPAILANPKVKRAFVFTLVDGTGTDEQSHFGLFRSDWTPKPAADAVRKAVLG